MSSRARAVRADGEPSGAPPTRRGLGARTRTLGLGLTARSLAGALAVLTVLAGCSLEESEPSTTPAAEQPTPTPAPPPRPLEPGWYSDADGNSIPDLVEQEIERDPAVDECLADRCPLPEGTSGQELADGKNTLVLLDSSGSMAGPAGGKTKLEAAKEAISNYVATTPRSVDRLGLAVYGHRGSPGEEGKAESCREVEVLAPIGELDEAGVDTVLRRFSPTGWTPVAGALQQAERAFAGREGEVNQVILVSDGVETCGGDPVQAARRLKNSGIDVTVDVVGFDIRSQVDVQRLRDVAEAGGGEYVDAKTAAALNDFFDRLAERRAELRGQLLCVSSKLNGATLCQSDLYSDAVLWMNNQRTKANLAQQRPRAQAIGEVIDKVSAARDRAVKTPLAERKRRLDELGREIEEIDRRLER